MLRQRLGLLSSVLLPMWRAHRGDRFQPFFPPMGALSARPSRR
jgi:hypothetical protein